MNFINISTFIYGFKCTKYCVCVWRGMAKSGKIKQIKFSLDFHIYFASITFRNHFEFVFCLNSLFFQFNGTELCSMKLIGALGDLFAAFFLVFYISTLLFSDYRQSSFKFLVGKKILIQKVSREIAFFLSQLSTRRLSAEKRIKVSVKYYNCFECFSGVFFWSKIEIHSTEPWPETELNYQRIKKFAFLV